MDFFIPGVPLEQIRFAGLRLQRGGVGFYPTSGSPFVHLDTGSIRHWPRMTHDQLARVFPDGRTVHVPTDGTPLKGYELALADIEKRGDGDDAATMSKPSLFASLFGRQVERRGRRGRSAAVPTSRRRGDRVAAAAAARSADARADAARQAAAFAATFQLASADAQIVRSVRRRSRRAAGAKRRGKAADARPTSSMPAASGTTLRRRRSRRRRRRSPRITARQALGRCRSADRPPAFPTA